MAQKLALPINNCTITAMYQEDSSPAYEHDTQLSGGHFGLDMNGTPNPFYASGNGKVVGVGGTATTGVGYWIAIQYDSVYKWSMTSDTLTVVPAIVMRYFHLAAKPNLSVGTSVTLDTIIGTIGNTGERKMYNHLHIEVDTDTKYPTYTPTLTGSAGGLSAGVRGSGDTTFDPCSVLFVKETSPENQSVTFSQSYCNSHPSEPYINEKKVERLAKMTF